MAMDRRFPSERVREGEGLFVFPRDRLIGAVDCCCCCSQVFTLPNLRPYGKYKLTAYTGCQVRRVAVIPFTSRSDETYKENCLVCLSNQGDFHILSLPDLRRQMNAQAIRREDIQYVQRSTNIVQKT